MRARLVVSFLGACILCSFLATTGYAQDKTATRLVTVLAVDGVARQADLPACADVLSIGLYQLPQTGQHAFRISFLSLAADATGRASGKVAGSTSTQLPDQTVLRVEVTRDSFGAEATLSLGAGLRRDGGHYRLQTLKNVTGSQLYTIETDRDAVWLPVASSLVADATIDDPVQIVVTTLASDGTGGGERVVAAYPTGKAYEANCAFLQHGNQGLGYTDAFVGRWDDTEGSGFDEALQIHESTSIPGNFHLAGTLQSAAEWSYNNGDPLDFNGWLAAGVTAGWVGMVSSAYAQHIMPFVSNEMNDWAVNVLTQMTDTRYGYYPPGGLGARAGLAQHQRLSQRRRQRLDRRQLGGARGLFSGPG
ncbi:MAG: hypothetical protein ABIF77_02645 [bacterium]